MAAYGGYPDFHVIANVPSPSHDSRPIDAEPSAAPLGERDWFRPNEADRGPIIGGMITPTIPSEFRYGPPVQKRNEPY
jgi:hypothetical protein